MINFPHAYLVLNSFLVRVAVDSGGLWDRFNRGVENLKAANLTVDDFINVDLKWRDCVQTYLDFQTEIGNLPAVMDDAEVERRIKRLSVLMFQISGADGGAVALGYDPMSWLGWVDQLIWLGNNRSLTLAHHSPVYGDDDDQSEEWRVTRESGGINDREWTIVGRGESPIEAIAAARKFMEKE